MKSYRTYFPWVWLEDTLLVCLGGICIGTLYALAVLP